MAGVWEFVEYYRGHLIERHRTRGPRKRYLYRFEVPGRHPRTPGGHARAETRTACRRFVDQALARIAAARERR